MTLQDFILPVAVLFGAVLTFFSGFGLGTVMLPLFSLFYPIDAAILLTAVIHFASNIFKIGLMRRHINFSVVVSFGIPALTGAFLGAWMLDVLSTGTSLFSYMAFGAQFHVTLLKLVLGIVMLCFALIELLPFFANLSFDSKYLPTGGVLSGFFGGLSGHQGALRSAFLARLNLQKEVFIGTGVIIALLVDVVRISFYLLYSESPALCSSENARLMSLTILSALIGTIAGKKLLKKVTIRSLQIIIGYMLIIISMLLIAGVI